MVHIHREVPKHQQDGSNDYIEHDQFIEPPSTELQSFNGHILMSIPHFKEQIAAEPETSDLHNKTSKDSMFHFHLCKSENSSWLIYSKNTSINEK